MKQNEFIAQLQDILQKDEPIEPNMALCDLEEWDSLSAMAIIAFYENFFNVQITFENLDACHTVADVIALAGNTIEQD